MKINLPFEVPVGKLNDRNMMYDVESFKRAAMDFSKGALNVLQWSPVIQPPDPRMNGIIDPKYIMGYVKEIHSDHIVCNIKDDLYLAIKDTILSKAIAIPRGYMIERLFGNTSIFYIKTLVSFDCYIDITPSNYKK